jgi:hypothetical protein
MANVSPSELYGIVGMANNCVALFNPGHRPPNIESSRSPLQEGNSVACTVLYSKSLGPTSGSVGRSFESKLHSGLVHSNYTGCRKLSTRAERRTAEYLTNKAFCIWTARKRRGK